MERTGVRMCAGTWTTVGIGDVDLQTRDRLWVCLDMLRAGTETQIDFHVKGGRLGGGMRITALSPDPIMTPLLDQR